VERLHRPVRAQEVEVPARVCGYLDPSIHRRPAGQGRPAFVIEPRPFELALETSKAQLAQTEAQVQLAQQQLDRTAQLRKNDYATKETYDERVSQLAIATASRDAALAAVNQAQLNLDYTRVTAPVAGRMGRQK
jgi:multidrug efflux pump subunit AcrA (membrane-fusion protein)